MTDGDQWHQYVEWARRLITSEPFDEAERTYKLQLSRDFNELLGLGLSSEAALHWLRPSYNNVPGWRLHQAVRQIEGGLEEAIASLVAEENDLRYRLDRFSDWLSIKSELSDGAQTTLTSALLMGVNATQYPPYKTEAMGQAIQLAGWEDTRGSVSERYLGFLSFLDDVVAALSQSGEREFDRLDAQGAAWVIGGSWPHDLLETALGEKAESFMAWQSGNAPDAEAVSLNLLRSSQLKWWVNQGATYRKERDGSYIWAPQLTRGGHAAGHHKAVMKVRAGDAIVHYASGRIQAVGIAESDGYEADRPDELPEGSWQVEGYRADVRYVELEREVPLDAIALEPRMTADGPFTSAGAVRQGYLYYLPDHLADAISPLLGRSYPANRLGLGTDDRHELVPTPPAPFDEVVTGFARAARESGLDYGSRHEQLIRSFVTALATKPFVILTGLSGSGKTRLAQTFGHWLGAVRVVAVRPDWTSPDALLGFENALSVPDGNDRHAWNVPETLEFILEAKDNPRRPYLLLLDEMNLAHVERYFADVLSGMETNEPILPDLVLGDGAYRIRSASAGKLALPKTLFIVGTVNVDETTYMFSPKVLDRANTFEFRVTTEDLVRSQPTSGIGSAPPEIAAGFLAATESAPDADERFATWMSDVHRILTKHDREFGHRTFQEALRFAALLREAGEVEPKVALDCQIAQKVLPKLHGSRRELAALLDDLGAFCMFGPDEQQKQAAGFDCASTAPSHGDGAALPASYAKLHRMARKLRENHFVSFAE